jgi:lipid A disaccharide synthetase
MWHLFGRWLVNARTFSLVNLLNDGRQKIVPEFVPWYGSNEPVIQTVLEMLQKPEMLSEQREKVQLVIRGLNRPGASKNAARLAMDLMEGRADTEMGGI